MNKAYLFLLLGVLVGCQTMPPAGTPPPTFDPPITTAIPAGYYSGEITHNFRHIVNGLEVTNTTDTSPYSEIVDDYGLPVMFPGKEIPVIGLRLERLNDEGAGFVFTIESINASGNELVIGFKLEIRLGSDTSLNGTGQWLYEYIEPDTLTFSEAFSAFGTLANGQLSGVHSVGTATLTK